MFNTMCQMKKYVAIEASFTPVARGGSKTRQLSHGFTVLDFLPKHHRTAIHICTHTAVAKPTQHVTFMGGPPAKRN